MQEMLKSRGIASEHPYKAFHPLIRLKGNLTKVHVTKLTSYQRFIYLNPIEGVLTAYRTADRFPHDPHMIMHLNQITTLEFMRESKWYHTRGYYYMEVATEDQSLVFMGDNLDLIMFWISQISIAKKFFVWLKDMIRVRYKVRQADCVKNCTD